MMRFRSLLLLPCTLVLSSCFATRQDFAKPETPPSWSAYGASFVPQADIDSLQEWWKRFDDVQLNQLVALALRDSPDRLAAEARILEARGLRRSSRSFLLPQLGASGNVGRQDTGFSSAGAVDDFYDARFDASYEIDLFGKNRNAFSAASRQVEGAEASYHDVTLTLVADVVRNYIDYRTAQKQLRVAEKNLALQERALEIVYNLYELGESPALDVEQGETIVNTTRASIPEFKRQAENAIFRLSVLVGVGSEKFRPLLSLREGIPGADVRPVLAVPAQVLAVRPDIRAASANLAAKTDLAESATAELFPAVTLSGFYGISDGAFVSNANVWSIAVGAAVSLLDFGRIEGRIDAARARESEAYQMYRKSVLEAVSEVETALNDYSHRSEQRASLQKAYNSAEATYGHAKNLYDEGEVSFLNVIDAQRSLVDAEAALVSAEATQAESVVRLFKSLGVY